MQSHVCHQYFYIVRKWGGALLSEIFELFLSEVWVTTGISMTCDESVASAAPSTSLSWTSVVSQRTRKGNLWGTAASDYAERVVWGKWEVRLVMDTCLWNRLALHSDVERVHVHPLLCTPSPVVMADDIGYQMIDFFQFRSQIPPPLDQQKDGFKSKRMSLWNFNDVFPNSVWI